MLCKPQMRIIQLNLIKFKNDTTLSIELWTLKQKQQASKLTWETKG